MTAIFVSPLLPAFGHSAGAQLAALLGMEDTRDNSDPGLAKYSSKVQAMMDVSGPVDFPADHFSADRGADGDKFLTNFLGGDYAGHPETWQNASPVFHAAKVDDGHTFHTPAARRQLASESVAFFDRTLAAAQ